MSLDPDQARVEVARLMLRAKQPLGAAVLLGELTHHDPRDAEVWAGLGIALIAAGAGAGVRRKHFELLAGKVLARAVPLARDTNFAPLVEHWLGVLGAGDATPIQPEELVPMMDFLVLAEPEALVHAIDGLAEGDRMFAVMMIGDHGEHASAVIRHAILGRWGVAVARSGLKRVRKYLARADIRAAIAAATRWPNRAELEPYLGWALDRLAET